jgi:hypothetical protein
MIPKVIYICYKDLDTLKEYSGKWKSLNPDWEIQLYDDNLCESFLKREYSQLYADIFNYIPHGPIKADFFRVCILNKYGGLYVDADIEPFVSLDTFITNKEYLVTCLSYFKNSYNPHFILADKNNEIIKKCIDAYLEMYENKKPYSYWAWSIVLIFNKVLDMSIHNNKSGFYYHDNKTYKFLKEGIQNEKGDGRQYCYYDGVVVLSNRYLSYQNHGFVKKWFESLFKIN